MQELNLDVAGEFLVMAATLIHIKSKMLLPRPETAAGVEGEEEDPRDALVRRLLEHQKFKAAAELLHEREQVRSAQWQRPDERVADLAGDEYEPELEVDLFSLLTAFQAVVRARASSGRRCCCRPSRCPVEARIEQLLARLSETEACGFEELFADVDRPRRPDRHVPGAARDDSAEAGPRVPVGQLRPDSRLQAGAAGRCAASDWRSGGESWLNEDAGRRTAPDGRRRQEASTGRRTGQDSAGAEAGAARRRRTDASSLPERAPPS